jgi:predicted nucleic acid-binding protein
MKRIAIQDANILIDLVKTGLFDYCLALQYQFTTTDIILNELYDAQAALIAPHIISGKFLVIEISADELIEIQVMSLEDTRLSEQDWSAVYYAKQKEALLLSGDKRLRGLARAKGLTVFGIFWLLDQLVETDILSKREACSFLQELISINKRLPSEECERRIKLWCNS